MAVKTNEPLTIGLDIGIASVGWAVLGENRIIDLGVRCFDKAETAKEGESLNLARRTARLMRRRLRHRAWRLTKLARLLKREGLIADANMFKRRIEKKTPFQNPWKLRAEALDRCLSDEEWARVIYHLCKHRGFHWISRAEEKAAESDNEGGKVKKGLAGTKKLMQEKNYRTAAVMVLAEFPEAQRNKQGDYSKALSRSLLSEEFALLFKRQRELGNSHANKELETAILGNSDKKSGVFWEQKPALSGNALLAMLGHCTFEKAEYRAPKASFSAERHVWLTRLNNLRIVVDGKTRPLNDAERRAALPLPYLQAGDFTYKQLRTKLVKDGFLPGSFRFAGLSYPSERQKTEEKAKDPESERLTKLTAWQTLRKTLRDAGLETEWQKMSVASLEGNPELLDQIAWVLSVYKDGEEVEAELRKLPLPNAGEMIEALLNMPNTAFSKFHALSLKVLRQIVPHMEAGLRHDEACEQAGYHHSELHKVGEGKHKYLPPFYAGRNKDGRMVFSKDTDIPRNPVVLRALNQARKVVNALIRKYGSPHSAHIEMARDLSKPLLGHKDAKGNFIMGRLDIQKEQKEYQAKKEASRDLFIENNEREPKRDELLKMRLFREQLDQCPYCGKELDINRMFSDENYAQIDHVLPYSRSFDDSLNNKVVVHAKCNQDKGNRTPYEYLGGAEDSPRWRQFIGFVKSTYRAAKANRLLRKDFGEKEAKDFRERNLSDTRYICRFFKNYVELYLKLHEDSDAKRCVVLSGQMTSFLRARWGLVKVRGDSDRHHALDAVVVAACSHSMVKRLSDYSRRKELEQVREGFIDVATGEIVNPSMFEQLERHFPSPWSHFRDELLVRLNTDDHDELRAKLEPLCTYPTEALEELRPLFISRAPQRRNSGAAHKETIYAQSEELKNSGSVTQKVAVTNLKPADVDKLIDPHRNEKLYAALREWLQKRDEQEKRAKEIEKTAKEAKRELTQDEKTEIERLRALPRKPVGPAKPEDYPKWLEKYKGPKDQSGNPIGPIMRTVTMVIDKLSGIPIRGGIAKNDTMLRVDVFRNKKDSKFHLVPVYVHHSVKGLPNRAIIAYKDEAEWTVMDNGYDFCFSLYSNDLARITLKKECHLGYYAGCDRSTGALTLWAHDRNQQVGKDGLIRGIGVKTALNVEKFNVGVLGHIYPAPPEKRRDLA